MIGLGRFVVVGRVVAVATVSEDFKSTSKVVGDLCGERHGSRRVVKLPVNQESESIPTLVAIVEGHSLSGANLVCVESSHV